jgi:hypothetical protein
MADTKSISYGKIACDYCGGLVDEIDAKNPFTVNITLEGIEVTFFLSPSVKRTFNPYNRRKTIVFPMDNIKDVSFKTDEQISKDVTLTRLLLTGVLAFGLKKKSKNVTNYLTIEYDLDGIHSDLILKGASIVKLNSLILKARRDYLIENPLAQPIEESTASNIPSQIKQLSDLKNQGILTEEEFSYKKAELLAKM